MTQATPTLTGQVIAEAQGAMRALIDEVLAGADVTSTEYVVLRVLAVRGPYEDPAVLYEFLAGQRQLHLTRAEAVDLLDGLAARGLVDTTGPVRVTSAGEALIGRLTTESIMPANIRLYADLHPADLVTAHNVLTELVRRANRLTEELRDERDGTR
jgi:DNA-binding MarR family transcriptional regulator